ncbi:hypothetical protein T492DRAFT_839362 [Pavlovales sp. CCMP2436]|nr:hypothetical protein T492DRAFT_839362 [Pavlovales sp. CCMP2436]
MWMGVNVGSLGLCRAASRLAGNRTGEGGAGGGERTSTVDGLDGRHREALVAYNPDFNFKEKKKKRIEIRAVHGLCVSSSGTANINWATTGPAIGMLRNARSSFRASPQNQTTKPTRGGGDGCAFPL